jgi:PAS domain-containing protein
VRWFGTNTDVTEDREHEAALREASERVELSLDAGAILGTWVWSVQNDRLTGDERFARFLGLDPERCRAGFPQAEVMAAILPEDRPQVRAAVEAVLESGGSFSAEYRVRLQDGAVRWVEANGRCELDADGRAVRFPGVLLASTRASRRRPVSGQASATRARRNVCSRRCSKPSQPRSTSRTPRGACRSRTGR